MIAFGPSERFALVLAAAMAVVVALTWRHRRGAAIIVALAALPSLIVALASPQFDLVGWHGFMHAAPTYQIMERGLIPPEEPLWAGGTLRYPWMEYVLVARIAGLTGLNVHLIALTADAFAFLVFLGAIAWLASAVTKDRITIALSMLIGAFGISVFHVGLLVEPLARLFPGLWLENRIVPLDKFLSITAMPVGYAAMAVAAAAGVHFAQRERTSRRLALLIGVCTLVAALMHPLSWIGILAWQGVIGLMLLWSRRREDLERATYLAAAVIVPSLLCFPYLRQIGTNESSDGWSGVTRDPALLGAKLADLALFLAAFEFLAYLHRHELARRIRERHRATMLLLGAVAALSAAYLVTRLPGRNEYKFMLHLEPAAAVIMALALRHWMERRRVFSFALLFLLLIPGARALGYRPWFIISDPVRMDGPYLRALDPDTDALYRWIAANTPPDAVFIAPDLRVPPLGRRSLYVPADKPWRGRDGWGLSHWDLLMYLVRRPDEEMRRRQRFAMEVLSAGWGLPSAAVMAIIETDVPGRPIYVHAADPMAISKLDATSGFSRLFANRAGAVYSYGTPSGNSTRERK